MSDEQIDTIINHEVALEDSHPRGEKPKFFGEIIEQLIKLHPLLLEFGLIIKKH